MPKGIPNKKKEEKSETATQNFVAVEPVVVKAEVVKVEAPKIEPLQPGQKYFETPDGELISGEESKTQIWHRKMNNGRGGWVNPKR